MITLHHANLRRGPDLLLEDVSLSLPPGSRVGIIGANGAGKSSLFQLLLGDLSLDAGSLALPPTWRIAHMAQEVSTSERSARDYVLDGHRELRRLQQAIAAAEDAGEHERLGGLYAELEAIDGFAADYRAEQLLHGLGFTQDQVNDPVRSFSGGWRIRLNLARALLMPSDLLLLDEPTNHLDLDATLWLEQWLRSYPGTLLLISHDRDFLDQVVDSIVHLEHRHANLYSGGYSAFERQRAERLAQQQANYEKQQRRKQQIEQFVARFRAKATKARQAQSRLKELARMEDLAPAHIDSPFDFRFPAPERLPQGQLLNLERARLGYGDHSILQRVSLSLLPGTRLGLLGPNGAGKSTLVKSLVGELPLLAGERVASEHLRVGYFAQHQLEALDLNASPALHVQRLSPQASEQQIRDFLGGFDFHGDKALEPIADFSGGEKARLALALIVWQRPNLLLLDEPTNHLDLDMRHALTMALQDFEGALVVIAHDRHLLRNTVDGFLLVAHGAVQPFDGDLDDYARWLRDANSQPATPPSQAPAGPKKTVDKKAARQQAAARREQLKPLTRNIQQLEKTLAQQEARLKQLETALADPALYDEAQKARLTELVNEQGQCRAALEDTETRWLAAQEELETLEAQLAAGQAP